MLRPLVLLSLFAGAIFAQNGAAIYKMRCASCHDAPTGRVPPVSALKAMPAAAIIRALEGGVMKPQAEGLTSAERYALVVYLSTPELKAATLPASALCGTAGRPLSDISKGARWTGWSIDASNTRFQDAAGAGMTAADVPKLKLKWAFGLGEGGQARGQPTVAGGYLFVTSQSGPVYALDATSGCIHWTFRPDGAVRSGIAIATATVSKTPAAYFGDSRGNTYALDAATGKLLWKVHAEDHFAAMITGAPLVHAGVLYFGVSSAEEGLPPSPAYECCTFRGSVVALDAATGKQIWKTYTIADAPQPTKKSKSGAQMYGPSGAGVWSTPTFDERRDALYVATGDNYSDPPTRTSDAVLALDRKTGKMLWSRQLTANDAFNNSCVSPPKVNCPESEGGDFDFGQPPILVSLPNRKRALVIGQKSGMAHALDPDQQGELLWTTRIGQGGFLGGIQWGSAADRDNMYAAVSDLRIQIVPDPGSPQGYRLGVDPKQGGGVHALRLTDGKEVWSAQPAPCGDRKNCSPAQSGAVTAIPGVVFAGSADGHLRGYTAATGEVIWDVDTARDYDTLNGQKAKGGALDGGGAAVAGGILYVYSGYGQWGGLPGNVLLAFSIDGK